MYVPSILYSAKGIVYLVYNTLYYILHHSSPVGPRPSPPLPLYDTVLYDITEGRRFYGFDIQDEDNNFGVNLFCMSDEMAFHSLGPEKVICFAECSSLLWESSS